MIIHIAGAVGSGKTTLGKELAKKYKNVIVKDLDDLFNEFIKNDDKFSPAEYQKYIDSFINKHKNKNIILVGINQDMGRSKTMYKVYADYCYYLKIPLNIHLKQWFLREINDFIEWMHKRDKSILFSQLSKDEKRVINDLTRGFSISRMKKDIKHFDKLYKSEGYKAMSPSSIVRSIDKLFD